MRRHAKALVAVFIATLCLVGAAPAAFAASAPEITVVQATEVNATSARLRVVVKPNEADTTYRFEYGTTISYGQSTPVPDGDLGVGVEDPNIHQVFATATRLISGLSPDTTYHYRVRAENGEGPVTSSDHTLHTYPANVPGGLPENRAYELVSPAAKAGADIQGNPHQTVSSVDGNAVSYASTGIFADAAGNDIIGNYVARRGPDGWSTEALTPEQTNEFPLPGIGNQAAYLGAFTPDLSKGIFFARVPLFGEPSLGRANALYLHDSIFSGAGPAPANGASYQLLSDSAAPITANERGSLYPSEVALALTGVSKDLTHVVFESKHDLTQDTVDEGLDEEHSKVYEWNNGSERLASVLPDGTPTIGVSGRGRLDGNGGANASYCGGRYTLGTTSENGNSTFFTAPPYGRCQPTAFTETFGTVYARLGHSVTVKLNESERTDCAGDPTCGGDNEPDPAPDPEGGLATLWTATPDGSKAFFVSDEALTDDASHIALDPTVDPNISARNLYMYDFDKPAGERLTLISPNADQVVGTSENGQFVYFATDLQAPNLDPNHTFSSSAPGLRLYVWHDGEIRAVGGGEGSGTYTGNNPSWMEQYFKNASRVSADGHEILFESEAGETAAMSGNNDTTPAGVQSQECAPHNGSVHGLPCATETFLYDYETDTVKCVSCPPTGAAPSPEGGQFLIHFDSGSPDPGGAGGLVSGPQTQYLTRAITEDGSKVFFTSFDPLVPQDTNGHADAYVYDVATEEVHLLSTGECNCDSTFVEASPDGKNAFIATNQSLVRIDTDSSRDLYDVRVDGGIAAQNALPKAQCQGDACQSAASPPIDPTPTSASFQGSGNVVETRKVRHRHKHKKHVRKHHKHHRAVRTARIDQATATRSHG